MLSSTCQIAWRNLGRSRRRTALALLAIGVGQFALLATNSMMHGYTDNIRKAITGPMVGHVQVHAPDWRKDRAMDLVIPDAEVATAAIERTPGVDAAAARIYAPVLAAPVQDAFAAMVVGVDVEVESRPYGLLSGMSGALEPGKALVGYRLARRMSAEPGQEIAVVGQAADGSIANDLFVIQEIIKCPADLVNHSGIVIGLDDAQELLVMPQQVHEIVVRADRAGIAEGLATTLAAAPPLRGMEVLPWQEIVPELVMVLDMSDVGGYFVVALVFIAAISGIANTLMMSTFERMHEFGMLLALGSGPSRLVKIIVVEALLLGLLGVAVGTLFGVAFVAGTAESGVDMALWSSDPSAEDLAYQGLRLPLLVFPRLQAGDVALGLVAVMITSLLASIWPAAIAARLQPVEAMRA